MSVRSLTHLQRSALYLHVDTYRQLKTKRKLTPSRDPKIGILCRYLPFYVKTQGDTPYTTLFQSS